MAVQVRDQCGFSWQGQRSKPGFVGPSAEGEWTAFLLGRHRLAFQ